MDPRVRLRYVPLSNLAVAEVPDLYFLIIIIYYLKLLTLNRRFPVGGLA